VPEAACSCPAGQPAARMHQPRQRAGDGKYDLCEDDREWAEQAADRLGPLTDRQRDILGRLLHKHQ